MYSHFLPFFLATQTLALLASFEQSIYTAKEENGDDDVKDKEKEEGDSDDEGW